MVSKPVLVVSVCCAFGFGMLGMFTVMVSPVLPVVANWLGRRRDPLTFALAGQLSLASQEGAHSLDANKPQKGNQDGSRGRIATEANGTESIVDTARSSTAIATSSYAAGKLLFVAYLSAPSNMDRRAAVREKCFPSIRAAGYDVKFFIGRPNDESNPISRAQGQVATQLESDLAGSLQEESEKYGDVVITPFRDAYRDLTDKVSFLFRYGLQAGAQNILKIDDDWCPDMMRVQSACDAIIPSQAHYIGQYLWEGNEYDIMKGRDGTVAKFMTGVGFILSASLARAIFYDDLVHTLLFAPYGTSSDDANIGKWYDYAIKKHPELKFSREVVQGLVVPVAG